MLRPGFEPESSARKAEMIGRTTPTEQYKLLILLIFIYSWFQTYEWMGPMGFEPMAARL